MEITINISLILAGLVSILFSIIAYFIKQLHGDFRKVERDMEELKTTTQLIKTEFKSGNELLSQRISFNEKRIELLEQLFMDRNHPVHGP